MKKAYSSSLLFLLVLLGSCGCPLTVLAQLAIFNSSPSAKPGEAIGLQGSFSATATVYLQSNAGTQSLTPLTQGAGQATVQVPGNLPLGAYQLWVEEGGARSAAVAVNQARGLHFDTPEVAPNSRFRLFGRNLQLPGGAAQVRIGAYAASVNASLSDAYALAVTAPATLPPGTYDVFVTNGSGETKVEQQLTAIAAGSDFFAVGLPWATKFTPDITGNVYNVKTDARLNGRLAKGNGVDNDAPAIQGAIDAAAAAGGGVVKLPTGTYRLGSVGFNLRLKSRVVLRGAGRDSTTIVLGGQETATQQSWAFLFENTPNLTGLLDLTYVNEADLSYDRPKRNMLGSATEVFIKNCRFTLNESTWLELNGSNKIAFTDNIVTQGANLKMDGGHGPVRMDDCRNYYVARNTITYGVDGFNLNRSNTGVWENNAITRDGSAVYPKGKVNHVLVVNFAENFACLNNQFQVINKAAMAGREINDGETIIAEGGPNAQTFESVGTVVSASANNVVVDKNWLNPDTDISRAIVAIVNGKGVGQWRRVTGRTGNALALDRDWAVAPDASSRYATFAWGARNWLVQGNAMSNNRRGITLYHNATADVAIVGNTLTNNGSIDLTPLQRQVSDGGATVGFNPVFNTQIVGNRVDCSGDTYSGAFIGAHTVQHIYPNTFGTSVIGLEVRGNRLTARVPNVPAVVDDVFPNGYLNYLEFHQSGTRYADERIPVLLGSILQNNEAVNCDTAVYLNSGSYNTLVCNTTLTGTRALLSNRALEGVAHAAVGTSTACQALPVGPPPTALRTPENPASTTAGVNYQYYPGEWTALPDFATLTPAATGAAANFDLTVAPRNYNYAVQFTGYVRVPADGQYTFYTTSDDGSRLYIGSTLVVDNDGLHGTQERTGTIGLQAGVHALTVAFLQGGGDQNLSVSYQGPAVAKQLLPAAALARPAPAPTALYRVNAGGGAVTTTIGTFAADQYFTGGVAASTSAAIGGTANGALYQTERFGVFSYNFPVPNGQYAVVLHFAETYWTQAGQRVFSVAVEGAPGLTNYDIVHEVGPLTATTETLAATVADGSLTLAFTASVDQPKVSAIEVLPAGGQSSNRGGGAPVAGPAAGDRPAGLRVYPTPGMGPFTVAVTVPTAQAATLQLLDGVGRVVQRQTVQLRAGANQLPFVVPGAAHGLYQVVLVGADGQRQAQKVVIVP